MSYTCCTSDLNVIPQLGNLSRVYEKGSHVLGHSGLGFGFWTGIQIETGFWYPKVLPDSLGSSSQYTLVPDARAKTSVAKITHEEKYSDPTSAKISSF